MEAAVSPSSSVTAVTLRLLAAPIVVPFRLLLRPSLRLSVLVSLTCQCFWWLAIAANTTGYGEGDLTLSRRLAFHLHGLLLLLTYHEVSTVGLRILALGRCKRTVLIGGDWFLATVVGLLSAFHIATGAPLDPMLIIHNGNLLGASDSFSLISGRELLTAVTALVLPPTLLLAGRGCLRFGGPDSTSLWPLLLRFFVAAIIMTHGLLTQPDVGADALTPLVGALITPSTFNAVPVHGGHVAAMGIRPFDRFPFLQPHGPVPAERVLAALSSPAEGAARLLAARGEANTTAHSSPADPAAPAGSPSAGSASAGSAPLPSRLPHIFYSMLESTNGQLFMRNSSLSPGKPPMPLMNAWAAAETLWSDVFYSTTMQTSRSQESALCGSLPSFRQKGFEIPASELALRCLPHILGELGYVTFYFSAQEDMSFDNTGNAMRENMGFQYVEAMTQAQGAEASDRFGFGWADGPSYRAFWRRFDAITAAHPGRPVFAMTATIVNHYPFHIAASEVTDPAFSTVWDPITDSGALNLARSQRIYETSLHVADRHWKHDFFDGVTARRFDDAIVVAYSDHSCPFTARTRSTSIGAWEETFRSVFALRAPGRVKPGRLRVAGASIADLAPTLLRMLGIRSANHYAGTPLQDRVPSLPEDSSTGAFLPAPGESPAPPATAALPPPPVPVEKHDLLGPFFSPFAANPAYTYATAFAGIGMDGPATGAAYAAAVAQSFALPPVSRGRRLLAAAHRAALDVADGLLAARDELVQAAGALLPLLRTGSAPAGTPAGATRGVGRGAPAADQPAPPLRSLRGLAHDPHADASPDHGGKTGKHGGRQAAQGEPRHGEPPHTHRVHHLHADGAAADGEDGLAEERGGAGAAVITRPVLISQPYGGVELMAVRWPFKLRYIRRQNRFSLFDLLADPAEERDFLGPKAPVWPPQLRVMDAALRRDLGVVILHQTAFDERRLWPLPHERDDVLKAARAQQAQAEPEA